MTDRKTSTTRKLNTLKNSIKKEELSTTNDLLKMYKKVIKKLDSIVQEFDLVFGDSDKRTLTVYSTYSDLIDEHNKIVREKKNFKTKSPIKKRQEKTVSNLESLVKFCKNCM
jgi:ABC-type uncharacterized transport system auxiliary subunit